jgi:hypothetical protein
VFFKLRTGIDHHHLQVLRQAVPVDQFLLTGMDWCWPLP